MVSLTCSSHSLLHSPSITLTILSRDTAGNSPRNSELRPSARRPGLVPMAEKKSSIRVESSRSSEVVEGDKSPSSPPRVEPSWGLLVSQGFSNCKLFLTLMSKKWYMITLTCCSQELLQTLISWRLYLSLAGCCTAPNIP